MHITKNAILPIITRQEAKKLLLILVISVLITEASNKADLKIQGRPEF